MFSVIFEVRPRPDQFEEYLGLAKRLRPILERIDGFVDNERFESRRRPGWILSHSTWRDEKSVVRWRTVGEHHDVQQRGRQQVLADYHLRVGDVTADTDGPVHEQRFDTTETGAAKVATLTEVRPPAGVDLAAGTAVAPALGLDPADPGVVEHTDRLGERIERCSERLCLETAGSSLEHVLKCNVYCTSVEKFAVVNEIYGRAFAYPRPARIFVAVPEWPGPFDIEIDCIAAIP